VNVEVVDHLDLLIHKLLQLDLELVQELLEIMVTDITVELAAAGEVMGLALAEKAVMVMLVLQLQVLMAL
jgi:hypothetical protein